MFLSQSQFAKLIGCSRQAVNEMKKAGHIIMSDDGKKVKESESIAMLKDLDRLDDNNKIRGKVKKITDEVRKKSSNTNMFEVDFPYETFADMSESERRSRFEQEKQNILNKAEQEGIDKSAFKDFLEDGDNKNIKLTDLNRIKTFYQAQNEKLKYEKEAGTLISRDQVYLEQYKTARVIRDSLLGMPHRISHKLLHQNNKRDVIDILESAINKILENLAGK